MTGLKIILFILGILTGGMFVLPFLSDVGYTSAVIATLLSLLIVLYSYRGEKLFFDDLIRPFNLALLVSIIAYIVLLALMRHVHFLASLLVSIGCYSGSLTIRYLLRRKNNI